MDLNKFLTTKLTDSVMTDMMVDVETTSTNPAFGAIIQIAAVKFNFATEEVGPSFNRCLSIAPNRFWDESTREWWGRQKQEVFQGIVAKMEDPRRVIEDFFAFCVTDTPPRQADSPGGYRFWAKPVHFDWGFISSYFAQYGLQMPFHHRIARDLGTYIASRKHAGVEHVNMDHITLAGDAHNALYDCAHQLKQLFAAKNNEWGEVVG